MANDLWVLIFARFVLGCSGCKCRQVLSCSPPSQVPGTCDSPVMISIWVFSAFVSLMVFWASVSIHNIVISISGGSGFIITIVVYIRIYLTVRRHKNQIHSFQVQQVNRSEETTSYAGLIKSTVGVFYIYLVFLACYLPYVICVVSVRINSANIALKKFTLFSLTLIFLNSSLNPVIYCWKMRHIRHAVIGILLSRNRASH